MNGRCLTGTVWCAGVLVCWCTGVIGHWCAVCDQCAVCVWCVVCVWCAVCDCTAFSIPFRASLKLGLDRALLQSMAAQKDSNVSSHTHSGRGGPNPH